MASCDENEFQFASILFNHLFELLTADELAAAFLVLEHQEVTLAFVLLIKVSSNFLFSVKNAMSTEMHPYRIFSEDFLNTIHRALAFSDIDLDLGGADAFSNLDKFF